MDWQLTCRVCLENGDMVSLFDWDENKEQLGDKYTFCCGIPVTPSDSLPTLICLTCVDKLTLAYQFKQQCITSVETLKECLEEFKKTSSIVSSKPEVTETETITVKQENGDLLQVELPIENDPDGYWSRTAIVKPGGAVVSKAAAPRKKGRPRKHPKGQGEDLSTHRKKAKAVEKEHESRVSMESDDSLHVKDEFDKHDPFDDFAGGDDSEDPEFKLLEEYLDEEEKPTVKKRGRPRKKPSKKPKIKEDNGEDVLLQETIMAISEPIPDHILNPKPRKKYPHKKKYRGDRAYTCETCGASFTSNASLQTHLRRHLGIKPFVCSVCGYAGVLKLELRRHMFKHTGERPYKCQLCDRSFADWGSRQRHESVCGFATGCRLILKRHMIRHTGVKPYQCRLCDRRFYSPGERMNHERWHTGVRPYECSICMKSFTYSNVLANHMLTHTGEKKYSCTLCDRKFTKAHHLKYHNKIHHKDLYNKQLQEQEAKKTTKQVGLDGILGQIVDGELQIIQAGSEDDENEEMQVIEEVVETDRAVAGIENDFSLDST